MLVSIIVVIVLITLIYFYKKNGSKGSSDIQFTFLVKGLNKDELPNLKENLPVNFWQKPNTNTVFIFRKGTSWGQGRIGVVPNKYSKQIINDLHHNRIYTGKIKKVKSSNVTIKYARPSNRKLNKFQKDYNVKRSEELKQLLNKNYSPQKGFKISVDFKKNMNFEIGQILNIRFREKEHYIENAQSLELNFYNLNNKKIGTKQNHPDKIRRILRAHFNNYKIKTQISSIRELDEYDLKYYDRIPGAVRIDFHKNA